MIKPHLWLQIEFFSGSQESRPPDSTTTFHLGGSSGILQDKVRTLGALVLCSLSEHVFCCALLSLQCACVNERHALSEASKEPCSAVPRWSHTTYGRNLSGVYTDLPMPRDTQRPCEGSGQKRAKHMGWTFLSWSSFPGLFDHFIIAWGIRTTNLICQIIDIKGNCDPCCYYLLLLRPQVWKCLALLGAGSYKSTFGREAEF